MSKNLGQAASLTEGALGDAAKLLNKVWERSSQDVVETLQRAMLDTNISFDELATLSSIDRDTIDTHSSNSTTRQPSSAASSNTTHCTPDQSDRPSLTSAHPSFDNVK